MNEQQTTAAISNTKEAQLSKELGVSIQVLSQTTPLQQGWLKLCALKEKTFKKLQEKELAVQAHLIDVEELCANKESGILDLEKVQKKIKEAKSENDELIAQRKQFTGLLDERIIKPAMEFEKRGIEIIDKAKANELMLRTVLNEKQEQSNKILAEEEQFKMHFTNEYFRIATEFRLLIEQTITEWYVKALKDKMPVTNLKKRKADLLAHLHLLKPGLPSKFPLTLVKKERAAELFKEILPYKPKPDIEQAEQKIDEVFGMYAQDLKKPQAAAKAATVEMAKTVEQETKKLEIATHTNNLVAQTVVSISMPSSVRLKHKIEVVIDEKEEWALNVLKTALEHWSEIKSSFTRVKKWSKLDVEQMSKALADMINNKGENITTLKIKTVKK